MTGHVVLFPVIPIVAAAAGLSPGDASSVAPMGIPAGGTGEPGAMPSGEVMPSGEGTGAPVPIWEKAAPQPKSTAAVAKTIIVLRKLVLNSGPTTFARPCVMIFVFMMRDSVFVWR